MTVTQVGTSAILVRDRRVLLGRRVGAHGADSWAFPGGKCDFGERPDNAARRELLEETGIYGEEPRLAAVTNDVFVDSGLHFVTLHFVIERFTGIAEVREPHKCTEWAWWPMDRLPCPLFEPTRAALATGLIIENSFVEPASRAA